MFPRLNHRLGHYLLLVAAAAVLFLPNLGGPSLWDIDEGNNAEAAREMLERDDWVVPQFNYQLRVDKPALLYWLQLAAYQVFGVNEFAARLPSALAALASVLLTYELGRRAFGPAAGLLAGLMLSSTISFCAAAHFANPDALLNACTVLTFLFFWRGFSTGGRSWFLLSGAASGLAVLAKGPVGLVLPLVVTGLFLLWSRRLRLLWDRNLLWGCLAFVLVMAPWYAWVGAETKGEFLRGFFLTHNRDRFLAPMENHNGPPFYYALALLAGFAPWSVFLAPAAWHVWKGLRGRGDDAPSEERRPAYRFLVCWVIVYFVFFSISRTKLPNYILPLFPAVALLTADFLNRWRCGEVRLPGWVTGLSLACLALIGIGVAGGLLVAGGAVRPELLRGRQLPGMEKWAAVGLVPVAAAAAAWWLLRQERRTAALACLGCGAVAFVAPLAAGGVATADLNKAPRPLAAMLPPDQTEREVRIAAYRYFQPSLVFYCRRQVSCFDGEDEALKFLNGPLPVYLFAPAGDWEVLEARTGGRCRLLGRHRDLYRNCDVVVVTNQ